MNKGKFIVIEGGDGSGKTVQTQLLMDFFKKNNIRVEYVDFPQYDSSFYGKMVAQFLRGEFGDIDEVSPYLASLVYALDRDSIKHKMKDYLESGTYIVANRYATSNMAHQGAKLKSDEEKKKYLDWIYELEYKIHKIPKEDIVLFLAVPWEVAHELNQNKPARKYLKGKEDIHEIDENHRRDVEQMYEALAKTNPQWVKIECVQNHDLLSPDVIHEKIVKVLKERNIITQT